MINAILGQKIDQSQAFTSDGRRIPVTHITAGPCTVVDMKSPPTHSYSSLQLSLGLRKIKNTTKAKLGHLKKAGLDKNPPRFLREIRLSDLSNLSDLKPGTVIKVEQVFAAGDKIQVTGVSKGKGFQGGVRRHHFKGGPRTHGQSDRERAPGAIGQTTTPGRVYKGKRMAGRMGNDKVTLKKLEVIAIDPERNILTIKGLVPGGRNSLLIIRKMSS
ncbi:50S ribosomal protein L3 [Candidatus Gottesmanbacteria bacterium RIFCSPHIGHO2_01_FULL_39_10]|uniref:Large ribosomal subunit protein uL3 n=1 Tax=Candidatus Gottesmanbacteria bacterium RIFCSPHIGHO2_01_FULL_39_10 TaxID=1798375 RepID=A0A1F5ZS37_9BACT|nr:MAG: 50S ribosomal protein L3 [Candidatus Gottesmanbacteria bacterium RIFCSPHIGHO2_01_FULL_39_10]